MITTKALQKLAQGGDTDAQFRLGYRIAFGWSRARPTDWAGAIFWWRQAAVQNHARALFYLGTCYDNGLGVVQNTQTAMEFYERAAQLNHETAQYNLAFGYRNGEGVPQNKERGLYWLRRAADLGDTNAQRDLGYCFHEGDGIAKDFEAAVYWYEKAADGGDAKAQYNLALCYLDGDGVPVCEEAAHRYFMQAAAQKHRAAKRRLREMDAAGTHSAGTPQTGVLTTPHAERDGRTGGTDGDDAV